MKERLRRESEKKIDKQREAKRKKSMIEVERRLSVADQSEKDKTKKQSDFLREEPAPASLTKREGPRASYHSIASSLGFLMAVAYRGGYVPTPVLIAGLMCITVHVMLWGSTTTP